MRPGSALVVSGKVDEIWKQKTNQTEKQMSLAMCDQNVLHRSFVFHLLVVSVCWRFIFVALVLFRKVSFDGLFLDGAMEVGAKAGANVLYKDVEVENYSKNKRIL